MRRTNFRAYLPELLLCTLFFFILSAVIIQFQANAYFLEQDTKQLEHAVSACSEAAEYFLDGDGSLSDIGKHYPNSIYINHQILIYLSEDYLYCNREAATYYMLVESNSTEDISLYFYEIDDDIIYSIENCCYSSNREVAP